MTNQAQKNRLIKELTKELSASNLAIFAGAGLSVGNPPIFNRS